MTDHFIKNIEIKDFKCFDNFKAEGFARVNLIGGKNNVGKTAFIEASYINSASSLKELVGNLHWVKLRREVLNIFKGTVTDNVQGFIEQSSGISVKSNIHDISFKIKELDGVKTYFFVIENETIEVNVNKFSYDYELSKNVIFIGNFGVSNDLIKGCYSFVQKKDSEKYIDAILMNFDSKIKAFKIIDEVPQCKYGEKYFPVSELGDGVRHLVSIVTSLYASENGYIFIDEIDNGIHYAALDDLWNNILMLSKKLNVQIFATTHSKECIESYARVAKKLEEQDITYTILSKLKDGSIDAGVYDAKMLFNTLEQDHELRGW